MELLSCYHCCSGKSVTITYSECVFVALGIHNAMRMRHIVICGVSGCNFSILSHKRHNFWKNKSLNIKLLLWFSAQILSETFFILRRNDQKCVCVSSHYFCPILTSLEFSQNFFEKYSNVTYLKNPSSGSRAVSCGQTDGQTWRSQLVILRMHLKMEKGFVNEKFLNTTEGAACNKY